MSQVRIAPLEGIGAAFPLDPSCIGAGRPYPPGTAAADWRPLTPGEIADLGAGGNRAEDWGKIRVTQKFNPELVRDCRFYGEVRIAAASSICLEYNDLRLPAGLSNSTIIACDLGADIAVHNVAYMARMRIEERCILFNVDEMVTTGHAKFGSGVVMDGEDEEVRIWLEIANENGGRKVLPFNGMLPADAWIWCKYRDDAHLMERFIEMTAEAQPRAPGGLGVVGGGSVIKNSRIIKDVNIGPCAYIKGCNKLKNLTVNSDEERPTQIGEGCELVNGIIGYGCRVFYGVKAVRFILSDHSALKYGARLINAVLGPNSTISCCEVLNSLIFGAHEQHHNSSFLCAGVLAGMSNMASAATVGSNHNSRAGDGEILADRGFWPGLSVSLKHNSRFAAFCLIAKGAYPAELHIPLPFSLVSNHEKSGELQIMPGYWFRYNMYALARNASKTAARDQRIGERQHLEYHWLAPDTVDQMLIGRRILEHWAGASPRVVSGEFPHGRALLESIESPELFARPPFAVESGDRPVRIRHAGRARHDYRRMVCLYAVQILLTSGGADALARALSQTGQPRSPNAPVPDDPGESGHPGPAPNTPAESDHPAPAPAGHLAPHPRHSQLPPGGPVPGGYIDSLTEIGHPAPPDPWLNIGGQLMRESALEDIKTRIKSGEIPDWPALHRAYHRIAADDENQRIRHAGEVLAELFQEESRPAEESPNTETNPLKPAAQSPNTKTAPPKPTVEFLLDEAVETAQFIFQGILDSRRKDYENPFRNSVYDSQAERDAVIGPFEENTFIAEARSELEAFESLVKKSRGIPPRT